MTGAGEEVLAASASSLTSRSPQAPRMGEPEIPAAQFDFSPHYLMTTV